MCSAKGLNGMALEAQRCLMMHYWCAQTWRSIRAPTPLFVRVMKAKYFQNIDLLDSYFGTLAAILEECVEFLSFG